MLALNLHKIQYQFEQLRYKHTIIEVTKNELTVLISNSTSDLGLLQLKNGNTQHFGVISHKWES